MESTLTVTPDGAPAPSTYSRFVQRLQRRYHAELPLMPPGVPVRASLEDCLLALRAQGHDTGTALRMLRQLTMERLAHLDCDAGTSLQDITQSSPPWPSWPWMPPAWRPPPSWTACTAPPWDLMAHARSSGSSAWANSAPAS